jgi:hypothetical protein
MLTFTGLVLVLGGLGYIEEAPMTLHDTLIGFGISLAGLCLWIIAILWHHMHKHYNDI